MKQTLINKYFEGISTQDEEKQLKSLLQQIESLKNNIIALEHNNKFVISQTYITFDNNHNEITKYYNLVPSIERLEKVYKHKDKIKKLIYLNFPRLYKKKFYIKKLILK